MKINKAILAAVLGLGIASVSEAGTVYITGSSAARSTVQATLLTAGVVFQATPAYTVYQGGTTPAGNGGNYMGFVGLDLNGNPLTVQCHWTGSEQGVKDAALGQNNTFIAAGLLDGADHGTAVPASFDTAQVDLAMADNDQQFSRTKTPAVGAKAQVGVITFAWVRNPGLWTGTNVSSSQIIQALTGYAPRSVFSGNTADVNDYVYVSGRDAFSGTRVNAYGDSGFGILTSPGQVEVNKTTGDLQADTDFNGTPGVYQGDIGFSSGGTLAGSLGVSTVGKSDANALGGSGGYSVIGYLSRGDADTAIAAGAKECSYNGVSFSRNAIIEGNYSFWGYEYIMSRSGVGAQALAAYNNLKNVATGIPHVAGHSSTKFLPVSDMDCQRSGPNGVVQHN